MTDKIASGEVVIAFSSAKLSAGGLMKRLYPILLLLFLIGAELLRPSSSTGSVPQPIQFPSSSNDMRIGHQWEIPPRHFRQPSVNYLSARMDLFHKTFDVYTDADSAGNHFSARGRFNSAGGDDGVPPMIENHTENPHSGISCIKASFKSKGSNWGGWYFMNGSLNGNGRSPSVNWGDIANAGVDLRGATKLTFYAKGEEGNERVEFFALGVGWSVERGMPVMPYPDSSPKASLGYVRLTTEWKKYTVDLAGRNLGYVLGGFGWVTAADQNSFRDLTFYLDDIQFDKPRLDEPHFLVSYETALSSNPFDLVSRNVAYTYDNAVALIAFLHAGERQRARLIADALVYAQEHDRFYTDGRIRNAYQGGDLILPAGWAPNGKTDTARMPGFNDPGTQLWTEDEFMVSTHTGNMAWAMLGLLAYYRWAGGDKYLTAIERMGEWVEANCRDTRGAGGYTGGFDGWEPTPIKRLYKATEHNIDLVAAFNQLFLITENEKWRERANNAKRFILAMWDGAEGKFWTGTGEDGVTIGKDVIPVDIQAWAILALQEESRSYWRALEYAETHHKVGNGYDFNQDRDGVWHEGTAQIAAAYKYIDRQDRRQAILSYLKKAQSLNGGIHATDRDGVTTGFTLNDGQPWLYYRRPHVGATAWLALAEQGVNPFGIIAASENIAISGRVTDAGGAGIGGITVSLSGSESDATLTDNNGNYSFRNLHKGKNYTVTPSKSLSAFAPKSLPFRHINSNQTANFTSILIPIIASIRPECALQGTVVSNLTVTGANLAGSTFSFAPASSAIRVDAATINSLGTAATLRLTIGHNASGYYTLVATNAVGSSETAFLLPTTFRVLDPHTDSDGDGYPNGVEVEVGANPCDVNITPLTITLQFTEAGSGFFSALNTTDLRGELNEAGGPFVSILNTADPSLAPSPDSSVRVNEAVGIHVSILNRADPSQPPPGAPPDASVFVGETVSPTVSIRNTATMSGNTTAGRIATPDSAPPIVALSVPSDLAVLVEGQTVTIKADASDSEAVAHVDIAVNGTNFVKDDLPPYELAFTTPVGVRSVTFSATAYDRAGNIGYSEEATFVVIPDPQVTIRGRVLDSGGNPVNGATVIAEQNGLIAEFYRIETPLQSLPDLAGRTPDTTKLVSAINLRNPNWIFGRDPFGSELLSLSAARFTGYIRIEEPGVYRFIVGTSGISRLKLAGADVVDITTGVGDFQEASGMVMLHTGLIPIEVLSFDPLGNTELQLSCVTPNGERQVVLPEMLFPSRPLVTAVTGEAGAFVLKGVPAIAETARIKAIVTIDREEWRGSSGDLRLMPGRVDAGDILVEKPPARRDSTFQNGAHQLPIWAGFFR
jgi:hypothetical protein